MKRLFSYLFFLSVLLLFFLSGCAKQESFSEIPEIEFLSFVKYTNRQIDSIAVLGISYRDGDGDIGLNVGDSFPPYQRNGDYYYNFVIRYFEKQSGVFIERIMDPPLSARIPVLTPLDPGKAIKGVIYLSILVDPFALFDTIQLKAFIYDRRLHRSNEISTPEIILRRR